MQQVTSSLEADLAAKFQQLIQLFGSEDLLFRNFLNFHRNKIRRAIRVLQADLEEYEKQYGQSSEAFYATYKNGKAGDSEDTMIWAGLYERKLEQEHLLKLLK